MQQDLFLDYAKHFVKHLPLDQGKGKTPVILILDSYKSRWSIEGLEYLHGNNVWPFFIPSHSSTITQPYDCGMNLNVHVCLAHVDNEYSNIVKSCSATILNVILQNGWKNVMEKEREDLMLT
eukprot:6507672-Ditylum_brightwellii.AAC.1